MPVETASRDTTASRGIAPRETALRETEPRGIEGRQAIETSPFPVPIPDQFTPLQSSPVPFTPIQFDLGFSRASEMEHVRDLVEQDDRGKWDTTALRQELIWQGDRLLLPDSYAGEGPQCLAPSPWATAQLCQQLGIPTGYFRRCPPHLQEDQFNHWAGAVELEERTPDLWLLRGKGNALRGVLSARYVRIDNWDLLQCLLPLIDDRFQVSWHALTPESFHLRLVDPALSTNALPGDRLMVGLHVGNSEVGKRSVSIDAIVFRQLCSNGLIRVVSGATLLRQRHVSWDAPKFKERLRKAISGALVEGAAFMTLLAGTSRIGVGDMDAAIAGLGERWGLTLPVRQAVLGNLLATPASHQETLWALVNALTFAAQGLPPDDRYDLEAKAGWLAEHGLPKDLSKDHSKGRDLKKTLQEGEG